ncbi:MAG: hypothetical protein ACLQAR_18170, partial [Steroidobacteraceae bacterium]
PKMASEHAEVALTYAKNNTGASAKKHNDVNDATLPRSGLVQRRLCGDSGYVKRATLLRFQYGQLGPVSPHNFIAAVAIW